MIPFRFLHAADLHLDSPFKGMAKVPGAVFERIQNSTFSALERLIRTAIQEKVRFVLFAGDIFDLADRSLRAQFRFHRALETLAENGIGAFVVHGNHDPVDGTAVRLDPPEGVHVFGCEDGEAVPVLDASGRLLAYVCGISYAANAVTENLALRFRVPDKNTYSIGLLHTNVDGDPSHDNYAPSSLEELARSPIRYWALGHIHKRQILREDPLIVYPGNIQGRSVKETGPKGCYVVDVSNAGTARLTFHATDDVRWQVEELSIEQISSIQQLKEAWERSLEAVRQHSDGRAVVVRYILKGRGSIHHSLMKGTHLSELVEEFREEEGRRAAQEEQYPFVWIESAKLHSLPEFDLDVLMEDKSFAGDLLRISRELLQDDQKLSRFVDEALEPLFSHGKIGRWLGGYDLEEARDWLMQAERIAVDKLLNREGDEM